VRNIVQQIEGGQIPDVKGFVEKMNNQYTDWGFKYPQASYYLPLFLDEMPEAKVVVTWRHPFSIVNSRWRRGRQETKAELLYQYATVYERIMQTEKYYSNQFLHISLEDLQADLEGTINQIAEFLDRTPPENLAKFIKGI